MAARIPRGSREYVERNSTSAAGLLWAQSASYRRCLTSSEDNPRTRMTLLRPVWPDAMVTEDRGTFKSFARNSMQASLARPSMGGVVSESFNASPTSPVMAFFLARGWTLTAKVEPWLLSLMGIIMVGCSVILRHKKNLRNRNPEAMLRNHQKAMSS